MNDDIYLRLDGKVVDEFPFLTELKIEDKLNLSADAIATSLSQYYDHKGKLNYFVELTLKNLKCSPAQSKKAEEMSTKEYRKMRESPKKD